MENKETWTWGFRLSRTDVLILLGGALGTVLGEPWAGEFIWFVPFVIGHFFLFCNVFRISRRLELFWTALFLSNVLGQLFLGRFDWLVILLFQTPVTTGLVLFELLSEDYHGWGCSWVNPKCPDYRFQKED